MNEHTNDDREIPEQLETETRREPAMGDPGKLPTDTGGTLGGNAAGGTGAAGAAGGTRSTRSASLGSESETRRATGMGVPGTFPSDHGPVTKARQAAGGRLQEAAVRVRELGDRAASKNRLLGPTRPLAYNAADGIDHAADYVRTREIEEMRTDLETTVRRHPLASVAVAFMAGYTLRRLF